MKALLLATAAGLALTTGCALAADLYQPAPPVYNAPPPAAVPLPPVPSWTGFYLGINAGLAADRYEIQSTAAPGAVRDDMDRGIGGVQIGYNWQFMPSWIVGLEADFDGSDIQSVSEYAAMGGGASVGANPQWFGTVRPRLGFAVTPSALFFITGGWAYVHSATSITPPAGATSSSSINQSGWAAGFGVEYAVTNWLSFKTEYIYLGIGTDTISGGGFSFNEKLMAHTLKSGLNFKIPPF